MRRAAPYLIFGLVTLVVFWGFLRHGRSLYNTPFLEVMLGQREAAPPGPQRVGSPAPLPRLARVADNLYLLPTNLRVYNEGLKAGELRLWNPYLFCGYPLYADPMVHPFYPPHLLLHAVFPPTVAYELSLLLHLFFAGAAMFWAARSLKMSDAAGTVAGVAWMLMGYQAMWFSSAILLGVSVFFPLALMWTVQGLERRDLSRAPRAALAMGLVILGSHPQHALLFFLFLGAWIGVAAWRDRDGRKFSLRFGSAVAFLSLGVALVEILARLDTINHGFRRAGDEMGSLYAHPWALLSQALGLGWGQILFHDFTFLQFEFPVYAGVTLLALAIAGGVRGFREPVFRFTTIFAVSAFLVAFVRPLAELAQLVPGLRLSPPSRWLSVFSFCFALLAARGVDSLALGLSRIPQILAAATAAFVLACLAKVGPLTFANPHAKATLTGLVLALSGAVVGKRKALLGAGIAFIAILVDLLPPFIGFNRHWDSRPLAQTPEAVRFVRDRQPVPWRATGQFAAPSPATDPANQANNALAIYEVESLGGFEAIMPSNYVRFAEEAGGLRSGGGRRMLFKDFCSPLLNAAGLNILFLHRDIPAGGPFKLLHSFGPVNAYENPDALPRAYMVSGAHIARDEDQAAELLKAPSFHPRDSVVLRTTEDLPRGRPGAVTCDVRWLERSSDRVRLEVTAAETGYLVLSDTDYPGWSAAIDGKPTPIYRANIAFRALRLAAGKHQVEFRFGPGSVRWGLAGSLLSSALAIAWILLVRIRSRILPAPPA